MELKYIQRKFFSPQNAKGLINEKQVTTFWNWFSQVLTTIRFKRHAKPLWFNGVIYGLISKSDCNRLLSSQEPGTFIIRFSDSAAGCFAIAYSTDDKTEKVKHYLIKPDELGANKALPDFLKEKHQFTYIVRMDPDTGKLERYTKINAFGKLYKPEDSPNKVPKASGYVQNVT